SPGFDNISRLSLPQQSGDPRRNRRAVNHAVADRLHPGGASCEKHAIASRIMRMPKPFPAQEESVGPATDSEQVRQLVYVLARPHSSRKRNQIEFPGKWPV